MEQPVRRWLIRVGLIAVGVVILGMALVAWPRTPHTEGHAYPVPSGKDRILVEVLNGTARQGLARVATRSLRRGGLDVVYFGNADSLVDSTRVIVRRGSRSAANRVARLLQVRRVITEIDTLRRVDVTVILGKDYQPEAELHP